MGNEPFESIEIVATESDSGLRLDRLLASHEKIGSRSKAVHLIEKNLVMVNSKTAKPSHAIKAGDVVLIQIPLEPQDVGLVPLDFKLNIVYEDADVIVVDKPAGLVVHPAAGHAQDTLVNALLHHTTELSMGFNETRPGIVHRIDRDTSGLLVVAKNDSAHQSLADQFKQRTTTRLYWALIYGTFAQNLGTFESLLARHPHDRKRFASTQLNGKIAITHYKQKQTFNKEVSLVELKLDTGRTHQIRVHLSENGHPIVGDALYGATTKTRGLKNGEIKKIVLGMSRFALHACELGFEHPGSGERMHFKSDWPADLKPLVKSLGFIS